MLEHPEIGALYLGGAVTTGAGAHDRGRRRRRRGPQQPDHGGLPDPRRVSLPRARRATGPRRRRGHRGAAAAGLQARLVLDRPYADPDQPAAGPRRARPARRARARVHRARPGRARRLPGRRVADDVARSRAHVRGDRALLAPTRRPTGGCWPSTTRSRTCSRASASRRSASGRASRRCSRAGPAARAGCAARR